MLANLLFNNPSLLRASRGINETTATENPHVGKNDLATNELVAEIINLPAPVQSNVDHEAEELGQRGVTTVIGEVEQNVTVVEIAETEVAPHELEHEELATPLMSRSETADSVEIIGDVLA